MTNTRKMSPDEALASYPGDLQADALTIYLATDSRRRAKSFRSLWNRWVGGKVRMPVSVLIVLEEGPSYAGRARHLITPEQKADL